LIELGKYFEALITPLLEWVREPFVGPAIAGIIVIAGSIIIMIALVETILSFGLITRARQAIGDHSEDEFAKNFNSID